MGGFLLAHRDWFNSTALKMLLCQAACFLGSLGQMYFMDYFLGGQFLGLHNFVFDFSTLTSTLETIFPLVVSCSMKLFGPSGSLIKMSGICVLPMNIVIDKIYLCLWFWFVLLTLVCLFQLVRQAALLAPFLRTFFFLVPASSPTSRRQVETFRLLTFLLALLAGTTPGDEELLRRHRAAAADRS